MKHLATSILLTLSLFAYSQNDYVDFIEKVKNYQQSVKLTGYYFYKKIDMATFNVKTYIGMFDKLKIDNNKYVVDMYYPDNFAFNTQPYFYMNKKSLNKAKQFEQEANKLGLKGNERIDFINLRFFYFVNDSNNRAFNHLVPDDNEIGYFQYLLFREFGEKFALQNNSLYQKKSYICSKDELNRLIETYQKDNSSIDNEFINNINPLPQVSIDNEFCYVSLVENVHSGIFIRKYKILRKFPYTVCIIDETKIIEKEVIYF